MQFFDFSVRPTQIEILNFLERLQYILLHLPGIVSASSRAEGWVHPRSEHSGRMIKSHLSSDAFFT